MKAKYLFPILILILTSISSFGQLQGIKICIDPGHGGHDAGNDRRIELPHGLIFWESEGNFMTAQNEKELLISLGANVKMTRNGNDDADDIALSARVAIANAFGADYFHSNHTNAAYGGTNYSLVLFRGEDNSPAFADAKAMGALMGPNLVDLLETTRSYNRGDKSFLGFNLGVLRNTNMPATLSEGSFHDFLEEALRLKNQQYSRNYAWALAKSFCKYFKVDGFKTGRVGGIVKDRQTGNVINNVKVTINPGNITYFGDDFYNGFYGIGNLQPGTYTISYSRSGYFDLNKTVIIQADKYTGLDVSLAVNNDGAPFASFDITGIPAGAGDELTFDASKSADDGQIIEYNWDFGDSTAIDTGKIVKHAYASDGNYTITLTIKDNDNKQSSLSKTIEIKTAAPKTPVLLSVEPINDSKGVRIKWKKLSQGSIAGYRIYYNVNPYLENLRILADTNILKPDITEFELDSIDERSETYYFWITAVNKAGTQSENSDMYGTLNYRFGGNKKLLIVDGFHRRSSYTKPTHDFASTTYLLGLYDAVGHVNVSTCMNDQVISGKIKLSDFDIVFWFLGDESTVDETFNSYEQNKVKDYLSQGGKLFVTGAEIAWDLDHKGSVTDKAFYHDYLKAEYVSDGAKGRSPAKGISSTDFGGVNLNFSVRYEEDYPDVLAGLGGAKSILKYNEGSVAGIAYKGKIGGGSSNAAVVNLGFALETVKNRQQLKTFFEKLLLYFDTKVSTKELATNFNSKIKVYPTLVKDIVKIESKLDDNPQVVINVFNIKGERVFNTKQQLISQKILHIDLSGLSKGIYFLNINNGKKIVSKKIVKQ